MISTVLGTKIGMEARWDQRGRRVPITVLKVEPNVVVDVGDKKVLLGIGAKKRVKKPQNNITAKIGFMPRYMREVTKIGDLAIGDKITVALFSPQDAVKVTGITKGRGFAGGVKRWGFAGGPKTHGQSDRHRAPGSIGQTTTPGRVYRGKKMAGHYGSEQITVTGLEVIDIDEEKNQLFIKGAIPGAKKGFLVIEKTGKVKKYVAPPEEKPKEEMEEGEPNQTMTQKKEAQETEGDSK